MIGLTVLILHIFFIKNQKSKKSSKYNKFLQKQVLRFTIYEKKEKKSVYNRDTILIFN